MPLPTTSSQLYQILIRPDYLICRYCPLRYRLKPPGGGLRTKVMKLDGWLQFLMDAHLVDSQFTIQVRGGGKG